MDVYAFWNGKAWFWDTAPDDARLKAENYAISVNGVSDLTGWSEGWVSVLRDGLYTNSELHFRCDTSQFFQEYMRKHGKYVDPILGKPNVFEPVSTA